MSVQVINRLNQPIDFYAIKVINKDNNQFLSKHLGKIRTNHYQIEYFDMSNSNEYWVIGYLPKSKMVYFTQHSVQNKEADQKCNHYSESSSNTGILPSFEQTKN